jgi:hypothetical protein
MQNEGLAIARDLQTAVVFLGDISHFSQKRVNIAPFQIVRYRVLEDSVEGALMRVGKRSGCFHKWLRLGAERRLMLFILTGWRPSAALCPDN